MAFVGIKQIGQKQMKFNADGSVELINASGSLEVSAPQKPAPQQMVEQVKEGPMIAEKHMVFDVRSLGAAGMGLADHVVG